MMKVLILNLKKGKCIYKCRFNQRKVSCCLLKLKKLRAIIFTFSVIQRCHLLKVMGEFCSAKHQYSTVCLPLILPYIAYCQREKIPARFRETHFIYSRTVYFQFILRSHELCFLMLLFKH